MEHEVNSVVTGNFHVNENETSIIEVSSSALYLYDVKRKQMLCTLFLYLYILLSVHGIPTF